MPKLKTMRHNKEGIGLDYPMLVQLESRSILVVGAGKVAVRKVKKLLRCGAQLTVVSPSGEAEFDEWERSSQLRWVRRDFLLKDLEGKEFVFVMTNSSEVNELVVSDALKRKLWVNSGDQKYPGNFTLPSSHRQGDILITVSTGGKSPSVSKQIRHVLAEEFDDRWQTYLEIVERWRKAIRDQGSGREREAFWRDLLTREMVDLVRQGRFSEIEERIQDGIGRFRD